MTAASPDMPTSGVSSTIAAGTLLPWTDLTINEARRRLTGWHFAKESLSDGEREILYVAEGLLRLLDERAATAPRTDTFPTAP